MAAHTEMHWKVRLTPTPRRSTRKRPGAYSSADILTDTAPEYHAHPTTHCRRHRNHTARSTIAAACGEGEGRGGGGRERKRGERDTQKRTAREGEGERQNKRTTHHSVVEETEHEDGVNALRNAHRRPRHERHGAGLAVHVERQRLAQDVQAGEEALRDPDPRPARRDEEERGVHVHEPGGVHQRARPAAHLVVVALAAHVPERREGRVS